MYAELNTAARILVRSKQNTSYFKTKEKVTGILAKHVKWSREKKSRKTEYIDEAVEHKCLVRSNKNQCHTVNAETMQRKNADLNLNYYSTIQW